MKKLMTLSFTAVMLVSSISAVQAVENCATKQAVLEKEITIARQFGNSNKIAGLEKALAEVNAHCTRASVAADARKDVEKLEKKLADKQSDIREVQNDLRQAQQKGDPSKIAKYQRKLSEKQTDLQEIQQKLNTARTELTSLAK